MDEQQHEEAGDAVNNADVPTTFFLVRHGQSESNVLGRFAGQLDSPLTDLGLQQARSAAPRLAEKGIDVAYSSPLKRAVTTAKAICSALELELHESEAFKEMCFGPWQGRKIDDAEREWPVEFANYRRAPHRFALAGAETFHDVERRVVAGVYALADKHAGKRVLVVSHGVAIKVLLLHLRGQGLEGLPNMPTMNNGDHLELTVPPRSSRR